MTITSSFRLRNKLKERISFFKKQLSGTLYTKAVGKEEDTTSLDGMKLEEVINKVNTLMTVLSNFNKAIELANKINKEPLIELETLKSRISFYETIASKCRNIQLVEYAYERSINRYEKRQSTAILTIEMEPILNQKEIVDVLKQLKQKKDLLEEQISTNNIKTKVLFDESLITELL
ncbi:MAG: hypothetical protein LBO69_05195 [Ignavibacteria bacterium]|jgi:hypothetical protein|nr:hypothetical protein [Ignavibacteria bacterium]